MNKNIMKKIMKEAHKLTKEIMNFDLFTVVTCNYKQQLGICMKQLYKEYKEEMEYKKEIQEAKKIVDDKGLHMDYVDLEKCINKSLEVPELFKAIKKDVKSLVDDIKTKYIDKVYEGIGYIQNYIKTKSEELYKRVKKFPSLEYKYGINNFLGKLEDTYSNLKLTIYKHCGDADFYSDDLDRLKRFGCKDLVK